MGCDIHTFVEKKDKGKWILIEEDIFTDGPIKTASPFNWRSYGLFGFLANVRNYSCVPAFQKRGLPLDSEYLNSDGFCGGFGGGSDSKRSELMRQDYHSYSWLLLKELLEFDYDKTFEDRRYEEQIGNVVNGAAVSEKGQGKITTFREFLGDEFFRNIEQLKKIGNPDEVRIFFYFDN